MSCPRCGGPYFGRIGDVVHCHCNQQGEAVSRTIEPIGQPCGWQGSWEQWVAVRVCLACGSEIPPDAVNCTCCEPNEMDIYELGLR